MIVIALDTPIEDAGRVVDRFVIDTPIQARHLLTSIRHSHGDSALCSELFLESVLGLSRDALGRLTLADYAQVSEAIAPFLASFVAPSTSAQE